MAIGTILLGQKHLQEAELQIKNTTQPRLWLEVTLLGLLPSANIQPTAIAFAPSDYRPSSPPQQLTQKAPPQNPVPQPTPSTPPSSTHQETPNGYTAPSSPPPPPPSPLPTPPTEEVIDTANFDFAQIWQQVLSNIQQIPRRALLGQMCHLMEFNGAVARIGVKGKWYDKVKSDLPMIKVAFQQTFNREVQVTLETATASNTSTARNTPPVNGNGNSNGHNGSATAKQPPSPTYNNQNQATPPPQPPPPAPTKTAPITPPSTAGSKTPPPTSHKAPLAEWETDEVAIAAQRIAKFFDGQIIRFTDDGEGFSEMATAEWTEESDLDDE